MVSLVGREERRETGNGEVDARERHKVRLELVEINVEGTIEAKRCRDRRYDLGDKAVEVRERGLGNVQAVLADVVDSLVVDLGPGCQ